MDERNSQNMSHMTEDMNWMVAIVNQYKNGTMISISVGVEKQ